MSREGSDAALSTVSYYHRSCPRLSLHARRSSSPPRRPFDHINSLLSGCSAGAVYQTLSTYLSLSVASSTPNLVPRVDSAKCIPRLCCQCLPPSRPGPFHSQSSHQPHCQGSHGMPRLGNLLGQEQGKTAFLGVPLFRSHLNI